MFNVHRVFALEDTPPKTPGNPKSMNIEHFPRKKQISMHIGQCSMNVEHFPRKAHIGQENHITYWGTSTGCIYVYVLGAIGINKMWTHQKVVWLNAGVDVIYSPNNRILEEH
eukprot:1519362-Amphidinium_carterae.1